VKETGNKISRSCIEGDTCAAVKKEKQVMQCGEAVGKKLHLLQCGGAVLK
jgi:hypothetical protein